MEAEAQHSAGPDGVLPGEDGVGIELEPTAPHGDDRTIGRLAGRRNRCSAGGPSSNVGVSTAPSRRPAKSGWGPNPARPKPGGEESGNGAATGGRRARPSAVETRAPSWVASIRPPGLEPREQARILVGRARDPEYVALLERDVGQAPIQANAMARQGAEPPLDLVQLLLSHGRALGRGDQRQSSHGRGAFPGRSVLRERAQLLEDLHVLAPGAGRMPP